MLRPRLFAFLLTMLVLAGGCKDGSGDSQEAAAPKPPLNYAAVGASETVGTGADRPETEAWPRALADTLGEGGRQVTFTGLGFGGATVPEALASSVPKAEKLQPNLVTVWLNVNDLVRELILPTGSSYEQQLGELVRRLRRGGATTVLVANTPALEKLPGYLGCFTPNRAGCLIPAIVPVIPRPDVVVAKVDAYNQAIARVAQREGAVLVDLNAASLKARADGTDASLVSGDGFHPSTAGHAAVAATFADAATKAGV